MKLPQIARVKTLKGKRVIIRVDFNVPIKDGKVVDAFRIEKVIPTLLLLKKAGAKTIILSHLGREKTDTLLPVSKRLAKKVPHAFIDDFGSDKGVKKLSLMKNGDVVMIENLRKWDGEKAGEKAFAKSLAALGDIYVNEAFAVSHRKDASVYELPKLLPAYFGPLFTIEIENLSLAFKKHHPYLFILGGAKFETKMPLVKKYLAAADTVFIGGALANTFYKLKGYGVGLSLVDKENPAYKTLLKNNKLLLPTDVVVNGPSGKVVRSHGAVESTETIEDDGPETIVILENLIAKAKFVLWNGPLGYYEGGYGAATLSIAKALSKSKARAVVGGGDTVAAIESIKSKNPNIFVSTGGGAMLDFLSGGTLPAIEVILKKKK